MVVYRLRHITYVAKLVSSSARARLKLRCVQVNLVFTRAVTWQYVIIEQCFPAKQRNKPMNRILQPEYTETEVKICRLFYCATA